MTGAVLRFVPVLSSYRSRQGLLYRPSSEAYTIAKGGVRDAKFCGPLRLALSASVERHRPIRSFVSSLLSRCGPSAVFGFISARIVDAIKRPVGGLRAHVSKEHREVVTPFIAHTDSASSVSVIGRIVGIVATTLGGAPTDVLGRLTARARHAVTGFEHSRHFVSETPAGTGGARAEIAEADRPDLSAFTTASQPSSVVASIRRIADDNPPTEPVSSVIDSSHGANYNTFCIGVCQ